MKNNEKFCNFCSTTKPVAEFYTIKNGLDSRCKTCRKETNKAYREKNPGKFIEIRERYVTGKWTVYLLPDHNYVGYTKNIEYRMAGHRWNNRNTDNMQILHIFDSKDHAMLIEDWYHAEGWLGGLDQRDSTKGRYYITDGVNNQMIRPTDPIPEGWKKGCVR